MGNNPTNSKIAIKTKIIIFFRKRKKKKRICSSNSQWSGGCQGFLAKYYLRNEGGDFGENP